MKKTYMIAASVFFMSSSIFASPLINQWSDGDKYYCQYGDGEVIVIYGNQNCPLSN
ncbi:MAG: hypothetical protein JAY74_25515 [Candidatus Thiodiazotropha taylori]|nr:hypothetical protein [Candidatus Thiodiazotropha taylori]